MEFAVLGLFCGILILCIVCNVSIMYALLAGFVIFGCYAKKKGFSVKEILHMAGEGIWKVRNILITFMLIGMLTALWRQAGTIPAIICYTIHFIKPSVFLLMVFLLNSLVSVLTGTSFGTAATVGVRRWALSFRYLRGSAAVRSFRESFLVIAVHRSRPAPFLCQN